MAIQLLEARIHDAVEDLDFQAYLNTQGLLHTNPEAQPISVKTAGRSALFVDLLNSNIGNLYSDRQVSRVLYGQEGSHTNAHFLINSLRRKFDPTDTIYRAEGLGWGVGVSGMVLDKTDISPVYRLWLEKGRFVSVEDLALFCYGRPIYSNAMTRRIADIRRDQKIRPLSIESASFGFEWPAHRLVIKSPQAEEKYQSTQKQVVLSNGHDWSDKDFQDWLIDSELVKIVPNLRFSQAELAEGLGKVEGDLMQVLYEESPYIVAYTSLVRRLYGRAITDSLKEKLEGIAKKLRAKIAGRQKIYAHLRLGYSFGISHLSLQSPELVLLYHLWSHQGEFVEYTSLMNALDIDEGSKGSNLFKVRIRNTRRVLEPTPYRLGTRITSGDENPGLVLVPKA